MRKSRYIIYMMLGLVALCVVGRKPSAYDRAAALRKAEVIYGHAMVHEAMDSDIYAYRLLDYAVQLAPGDSALRYDRDREYLFAEGKYYIYYDLIDTLIAQWINNPTARDQAKSFGYIASMAHDYERAVRILEGYDAVYSDDWDVLERLTDAYNRNYLSGNDSTNLLKAIALCDRAERQLGSSTAITSQKVRTLMLMNDTVGVDSALAKLCRENPDDAMAYYYAADINSRLNRDDRALDLVKKAFRLDPDEQDIALGLALGYRNIGDTVQYMNVLGDWLTNANFDRDDRLQSFAEFLTEYSEDLDSAGNQWVDSIADLLIRENNDARINEIKAIFALRRMHLDDAVAGFKLVNSLDPSNYKARLQATILQVLTGDSIGAERTAMQALSDIPQYPDEMLGQSHVNLVSFLLNNYLEAGDSRRAIAFVDSLVAAVPDTIEAPLRFNFLATIGDEFSSENHDSQALKYYAKAYDLSDQVADKYRYAFYNNYAYMLADADTLLDKALDMARFASLYDSHNPNNLDTYAWVYFKRGEYDEAKKQIDYAIDAAIDARKDTEGYQQDVADGVISQEEAESDDNSVLLSAEERAERRARNIEQAIKYSPEMWKTFYEHAGDIAFFRKDVEAAVDYWTRALEIDPDDELLARKVKNRTYFFE